MFAPFVGSQRAKKGKKKTHRRNGIAKIVERNVKKQGKKEKKELAPR